MLTTETPFVSSIIPVINPLEKLLGMPKIARKGLIVFDNINKSLLFCKMDIITENKTIKPPIRTIVLIAA